MEDLPIVVLRKLFKMIVSPDDLVNCSRVCKNWQAAYETMPKPDALYLHFEAFVPVDYRLFYTNELVARSNTLQIAPDLHFLRSDIARIHFANIRKLAIFSNLPEYVIRRGSRNCKFSFQNQLNHFRSLEHFELHYRRLTLEDYEIDLPKLKVLDLTDCRFAAKNVQIILNTPALQVLRIISRYFSKYPKFSNFIFQFPTQLKHLVMTNPGKRFKFNAEFTGLEHLIIGTDQHHVRFRKRRNLDDHFLESLPNLKFLFAYEDEVDLWKLREQQLMFNLKDLKILAYDEYPFFNYANWRPYVQHRQQLRYWPEIFDLKFERLVDSGIPLHYFEENFLKLTYLSVYEVIDQSLLVEFLKKAKVRFLFLWNTFNLGQDFFDEVADFLTLESLNTYASTWNEIRDLSPLNRWNLRLFGFHSEQPPNQIATTVLKNASCSKFEFNYHAGNLSCTPVFHHELQKMQNNIEIKFYCSSCGWASVNDPNCSDDVIAGTVRHIESKKWVRNMTKEETKMFGWHWLDSNMFK